LRGVSRISYVLVNGFRPTELWHSRCSQSHAAKGRCGPKGRQGKTLDLINKGEGGFLDRDLYLFCANVGDGKVVAIGNPNAKQLIGVDTRTQKDANGKAFGQELYDAYQKPEGQITEVSYMFVRPGPDKTPAPKVSFATKVGDLGCGVGYYK
jgi:hypothetical protein